MPLDPPLNVTATVTTTTPYSSVIISWSINNNYIVTALTPNGFHSMANLLHRFRAPSPAMAVWWAA